MDKREKLERKFAFAKGFTCAAAVGTAVGAAEALLTKAGVSFSGTASTLILLASAAFHFSVDRRMSALEKQANRPKCNRASSDDPPFSHG